MIEAPMRYTCQVVQPRTVFQHLDDLGVEAALVGERPEIKGTRARSHGWSSLPLGS